MELAEAISIRRSIRSYKSDPVPRQIIEDIVSAAQFAPIGMKQYESVHISVVTDLDLLKDIAKAGASWGGIEPSKVAYEAPVLIIVSTLENDPVIPPRPNEPLVGINAMNAACMIQNMLLKAVEHGLGSVFLYSITEGINSDHDLKRRICVPEGFKVQASCALGYSGVSEIAPRKTASPIQVDYI